MRILLIATNRHNRVMSRMRAQPIPIGLNQQKMFQPSIPFSLEL